MKTVYVVTAQESVWNKEYGGKWEERDVVKGTFPTVADVLQYCREQSCTIGEADQRGNFTIDYARKEFKVTKTEMEG